MEVLEANKVFNILDKFSEGSRPADWDILMS